MKRSNCISTPIIIVRLDQTCEHFRRMALEIEAIIIITMKSILQKRIEGRMQFIFADQKIQQIMIREESNLRVLRDYRQIVSARFSCG